MLIPGDDGIPWPLCCPPRGSSTTDCGFGREGLGRQIAYYKCVALVEDTNLVRRELGLPEARVRANDARLRFVG
jgi:5-methyltetrahydropteroyltriglutamate--homocysteine methyltransferase